MCQSTVLFFTLVSVLLLYFPYNSFHFPMTSGLLFVSLGPIFMQHDWISHTQQGPLVLIYRSLLCKCCKINTVYDPNCFQNLSTLWVFKWNCLRVFRHHKLFLVLNTIIWSKDSWLLFFNTQYNPIFVWMSLKRLLHSNQKKTLCLSL